MANELWRVDSDWLFGYTEDRAIKRKIKRYYTDFTPVATYYSDGKEFAWQYRIPSDRKRVAKRVFDVTNLS